MRTFVALQTFYSPKMKSSYVEGLSYTIRQGNRYLAALAEVWALEGRVRFAHNTTKCTIQGIGHVCESPYEPTIDPQEIVEEIPIIEPLIPEPIALTLAPEPETCEVVEASLPVVEEVFEATVEVKVVEENPVLLFVEEPLEPLPEPPIVEPELGYWEMTKKALRAMWR